MNKVGAMEPTTEEVAKVEAELHSIFAAIDRIDERIEKDQREIDRLKAKTKAALARLRSQWRSGICCDGLREGV
jgi:peptidoglycan hydrolase CwlO-like protein